MSATILLAGLTAWQALFEHGKLQEPELELQSPLVRGTNETPSEKEHSVGKVLITGAAGAVGFLVVELAHAARSRSQDVLVTAVCSSQNAYYMKALGADAVASHDHGTENIEDEVRPLAPFELFLDLTGPSLLPAILSMHKHYSKENGSIHIDFETQLPLPCACQPKWEDNQYRDNMDGRDRARCESRSPGGGMARFGQSATLWSYLSRQLPSSCRRFRDYWHDA